ncbi:MAG TPA: AMP-binding protein [Vicinamibacterales bacterium]|nr:AMP-binding protein [Vicinamibacterales bacterium]
MVRDTLIDFFRDLSLASGDFLVYDDGFRSRSFTYREVGRRAQAFAAELHALGLRKGDKVVFWSENRPEWIAAFWACIISGIVVVPIDYRASPDFLIRVARIVSAKLILIGQDVPPLRGSIDAPIWNLNDMNWGSDTSEVPEYSGTVSKDDIAEIIFTSGATAEPKGVVITHRNVLANIVPVEREILKYRKYGKPFYPLRFLNLLPLSHMFGQAMATFIPPVLPGTVIFMRGYNPVEIVDQIKKRRVSVLVSVPKILDVLREHVARVDRSADGLARQPSGQHVARRWWKYRDIHRMFGLKFWAFVVGAAPLDADLEQFWKEIGFVVIQGYGLTETAPIVTLNHPFATKSGSVGKAIAGVEMKIADDGEILVRGENVTKGYFNADADSAHAFEDGWFHTGDVGELGPDGQLYIRGRKKEMIVTPEGLNVFPEDVEKVLNHIPGVRDSAVVGVAIGSEERVHAVLVVDAGVDVDAIVRDANARLQDHQKIRRALVWPEPELPRTEGTKKLKRAAIRDWVRSGASVAPSVARGTDQLEALIAKYAGGGALGANTTIEQLGLSSLDRVELMVALEDAFQTRIDESAFSDARDLQQLRALVEQSTKRDTAPAEPVEFPSWNRSLPARAIRRASLPTWILPWGRLFAWTRVEGREHLDRITSPVIFASNHQSHMDTPVIMTSLPARLRYRLAPAMAKEFFKAHFFPEQYGRVAWFTNSLNYYLSTLFFNAFPLPQREAGARQTLRYIGDVLGDGFSVLIFPEGERSETGAIKRFRPGIGMIASRLGVPVVPVRIDGLQNVLRTGWHFARPGRVRVAFGAPMRLAGDDYEALAKQVEDAVRAL